MATTLDLSGVRAEYPNKASCFNLLIPRHQNLRFPVSLPCKRQWVALRVSRAAGKVEPPEKHDDTGYELSGKIGNELTCVMKFGGSSIASAERMRKVAELILSFPEERPVIVLSAMGKTTDNLLKAGEKAATCGVKNVSDLEELTFVKDLHQRTVYELGVGRPIISEHLFKLGRLLHEIAAVKEMTPRTKDYLLSFGECMSTRIFAAYLNKIGVKARQYDAFEIGFTTTDDFTDADILEATYPAVAKRLRGDWISDPAIPVVTGFLGKGYKTCAVTTLGSGRSDLTATTIGKALGLREIQVWKDVDGVLTHDLNIHPRAEPVPYLTFDKATERPMGPDREGDIPVRVKNSDNPKAPGIPVTRGRNMTQAVQPTSLDLKQIVARLRQIGPVDKVFSIFEDYGISVDPSKFLSKMLPWIPIFGMYALQIVCKLLGLENDGGERE